MLSARLADDAFAIFLFHGVVRDADDRYQVRNYTRKHLRLTEFENHLDDLLAHGTPVGMDDVLDFCRGRTPPPRAFAITFDDGFENNLSVAAPALVARGVPAMLYATTRFIARNELSWTDQLELCLESTAAGAVRLPWRNAPVSFGDRDTKIALLNEVRHEVKRRADLDVADFVAAFCADCEREPVETSADPLDRKLDWSQLQAWAQLQGLSVGGHSHTHAVLSLLAPEALAAELDTSLALLAQVGVGPTHYSYPEGLAHCYSDAVIEALRARDVACSPTAEDGLNRVGADPFRLRRVPVT